MHISEGILSSSLLVTSYIITIILTTIGFKKIDMDKIVQTGCLSAVFFVSSLVHIPIGVSNVHLNLSGLIGILLGWAAIPAIFVSLIIQAFMFQYGGITTLGINTLIVGIPSILCHYLFFFFNTKKKIKLNIICFICGSFAVFIGSTLVSISLFLTNRNFTDIAIFVILSHIPIAIIEGIITMFCISFLHKMGSDILPIYIYIQKK